MVLRHQSHVLSRVSCCEANRNESSTHDDVWSLYNGCDARTHNNNPGLNAHGSPL